MGTSLGAYSSGSGFYGSSFLAYVGDLVGGHIDDIGPIGGVVDSCRGFHSVPGPLQTAQRAEFWGGYSCPAGV